ncbi:NAD(P)-dependent dehydrogenase, short-chain alcohol dehydrogenase family [Actinacidiphila alni]|uniref:NAD(P)-dependent dehydrogenase, short-chain alcohol dehydrogenase family n=1 Tax=Actinacidiphila alni TaxID=380248 RepID=A0A1I2EK40_9ACTN|nr:SDR family NAD(P)-dependent oxidoreductase [Actinacidiphila alni]SFE92838.1 NAD(P)-dependent dehydrogenase, short-chain alcohol dehydrogenase family [Actinacidiphila alni]
MNERVGRRMVLVTGSTDGLGRWLAVRLAADGARVLVHGRSAERAEDVRRAVREAAGEDRAEILLADLSDLGQVDRLADEVLARTDRLDVLVNNAGIGAASPGGAREVDERGVERRFAVNYLAGYRLTHRLLPLLTASAPSRIVNVSSAGQQAIDFADPMMTKGYDGGRAYTQSKLAQIMFTFDLARSLEGTGVTANALHPATYMDTTMVREGGIAPWSSVREGGEATLRLIDGTDIGTGRYFNGTREARADRQAYDADARRRLRELSEELTARV